jgi:lipoprotein-anchoring transpeptidase ErfK/SrfK
MTRSGALLADDAGCIRMINDDIIDLYDHTPIGTKVVVLPSNAD